MSRAQRPGDRRDDLLSRRRDQHDVTAAELVGGDEVRGFAEHQRRHDVMQRFVDDRLDLGDVPTGAHIGHVGTHPVHLVMIGTGEQVDELGVAGLEHSTTVEQSLIEERFAERQCAGLGDDGLIQVEERRGAGVRSCGCRRLRLSLLVRGRVEDGHRPSICRWSNGGGTSRAKRSLAKRGKAHTVGIFAAQRVFRWNSYLR